MSKQTYLEPKTQDLEPKPRKPTRPLWRRCQTARIKQQTKFLNRMTFSKWWGTVSKTRQEDMVRRAYDEARCSESDCNRCENSA